MNKRVRIEEVVTFIKATREEAVTLAYEIGGGEVHALHIQKGFAQPAENPVGYYVMPTWVGLTDEEIQQCLNGLPTQTIDIYARRIEKALKDKNT